MLHCWGFQEHACWLFTYLGSRGLPAVLAVEHMLAMYKVHGVVNHDASIAPWRHQEWMT